MYTKTHIHICGWLHQDDSAKQLAKWHWKELDSISHVIHVIHIHSIIWPNAFVRECSYTVRIPIMGWITISRGFTYFYIFVHLFSVFWPLLHIDDPDLVKVPRPGPLHRCWRMWRSADDQALADDLRWIRGIPELVVSPTYCFQVGNKLTVMGT